MIYNKSMETATQLVDTRQTKYVNVIIDTLTRLSHATNLELLREVQRTYPDVSATTIHRVTARLKERGRIGCAPKPTSGVERYDINPSDHHHFMCSRCSRLCDIPKTTESEKIMTQVRVLSTSCALAGTLTLQGICQLCTKKEGDV